MIIYPKSLIRRWLLFGYKASMLLPAKCYYTGAIQFSRQYELGLGENAAWCTIITANQNILMFNMQLCCDWSGIVVEKATNKIVMTFISICWDKNLLKIYGVTLNLENNWIHSNFQIYPKRKCMKLNCTTIYKTMFCSKDAFNWTKVILKQLYNVTKDF